MGTWLVGGCRLALAVGSAAVPAWICFGPTALARTWATAVAQCESRAQQCEAGPGSSVFVDHACMHGGSSGTQLLECIYATASRMLLHRMLLSMLGLSIILFGVWLATKLLHQQHGDASMRVQGQEQQQQENTNGSAPGSNSTSGEENNQQQVSGSVQGARCGMGGQCWAVLRACSKFWTTS
eukprot:1137272-Pelagomonas_calceolata.AAC.1